MRLLPVQAMLAVASGARRAPAKSLTRRPSTERRDRVPGGDAVERAQIRRVGAFKTRSGLAARALQLDAEVVLGDVHSREIGVAGGT